jgi:hypothetical protein
VALDLGQALSTITRHSLDMAMFAWPVSLAVLVAALLALTVGSPFRDSTFRKRMPWILASYVLPPAVVVVGAVLRYDWVRHPNWVEPPAWHGAVLWAVILIHAVVLIAGPVFLRGIRVRSAALVLPGFWLSLSAGFIAAIAIGGVGP